MSTARSLPSRRSFITVTGLSLLNVACSAEAAGTSASTATAVSSGAGSEIAFVGTTAATTNSGAATTGAVVTASVFTPVVASPLLGAAQPVPGTDGKMHLQYELQIVNAKAAPATLLSVDVLSADDPSQVIAAYDSTQVIDALRSTLPRPLTDAVIPTGQLRFLYLELTFQSAADVPSGAVHRLNLLGAANPGTDQATPLQYVIAPVTFPSTPPLMLDPPLSGDGWVDFNGAFNNLTVHRGSVQTVNGQFFIAQRYAIDYMRLDGVGRIVNGDPADVTANVAYGADVLAVADSTVVEVLDELPDQPPGKLPDPGAITMDTVDGNHIVLDLGRGLYGFYAHLQRGSVLVKPGQRVTTGEVMAKLGNSGNTSGPHLHFHVMDGPSVLGSEGQPYVIKSFQTAGTIDPAQFDATQDFTGDWSSGRSAPVEQKDKFPMNLQILNFPS